jgi:hypothetical protein
LHHNDEGRLHLEKVMSWNTAMQQMEREINVGRLISVKAVVLAQRKVAFTAICLFVLIIL